MYLNDKTVELDEFVKRKRILKMELSSMSDYNSSQPEETSAADDDSNKSIKKVYINNDNYDEGKKSFDDSFEIK